MFIFIFILINKKFRILLSPANICFIRCDSAINSEAQIPLYNIARGILGVSIGIPVPSNSLLAPDVFSRNKMQNVSPVP